MNYHVPHFPSLVCAYCFKLCVPLDRPGVGTGGAIPLYYFIIVCLLYYSLYHFILLLCIVFIQLIIDYYN